MQLVSPQIEKAMSGSSWIRRMFEAGMELKKKYGADAVCDFSLGNPDLVPPKQIIDALRGLADKVDAPAGLGYMPNAGYPDARAALAAYVSKEQETELKGEHLVITVGAAGGLNCLFRAILTPEEEVICPAPYFVEYGSYVGNYGGVLKPVPSTPTTFRLNLAGIEAAIHEKTRAVIINSPNNPAGVIYSVEELKGLADILARATEKYGRPVFLVSDEPYRFLAFDGATVPAVMPLYRYSVVVGSFSKNLALAGERVGYVACNPAMEGVQQLVAGVILTNRILGYVNAPCIGQRLMMAALGANADASAYVRRRKKMAELLDYAGLEYQMPAGTFYFFPKVPGKMGDVEFVNLLTEEKILAVPGSGFGYAGYIRLALCVDEKFIDIAREGFKRAADKARAM
ncbi:MAG: pyridoxal phosphate-dependent aminotransferase [Victivallales bacterium]|nr:pyridoxal phosphate-dependent aminotransferase [Victivallales bacterium]